MPSPVRVILGLHCGYMGDNGKENGNYYNGLYRGYIGFITTYAPPKFPQPKGPGSKLGIWRFLHMSYSLNSLKGLYGGLYRGVS